MTVTFEELGRATRLSVRTSFGVAPDRDAFVKFGMSEGWSQSLDRLQQFVTG